MRAVMWNETVVEVARCFVEDQSTIREVAKKLNISKSTAHMRIRELLEHPGVYYQEEELASKVNVLITKNKKERHIRGGNKTKQVMAELKDKKQRGIVDNN